MHRLPFAWLLNGATGKIQPPRFFRWAEMFSGEQLGLVHAVRASMAKTVMDVDGRLVKLTPGMSIAVEVQIGQRQVIEYFLSPLLRRGKESVRER